MPDEAEAAKHEQVVTIWKTVVEVQQHFNDISMRIRSMFVTILLALFASIGFLLDKKFDLQLGDLKVQFAVLIPLFGMFGAYLFYFIDRYWYHRLLVGAVTHGKAIETLHRTKLPELALTTAIGAESPYEPKGLARAVARVIVDNESFKDGKLHSDGKIEFFYKSVMALLFFVAILLSALGGVSLEKGSAGPAGETANQEQSPKTKSLSGPTTPSKEKDK